ncbi:6-phosphogluconolactonase [Actibacterium mucosum KCTC 23349]|uniref:6-phosphogluconolactonase n=1 Tax=Actibacterium mucosum KCTC 23349 TaxID=1454373 RepID=A0A037ZLY8_9RHOB|nr:6-phosphogluconolactonase [Actibacterium mucosum]KAJ56664.1 6-phosphogluconolactonase [Actibacterium mucosum KCTC 23349]
MSLTEYPARDTMMAALANVMADQLRAALAENNRALLVVPGGTTPGPVFDQLCKADLDWARVDVMLSDERWVPESSDRSNTRLLRERLLVENAAAATLLPLYADSDRPEDALDALAGAVDAALPIDVLLLGMGADMHTASIFPEADLLAEALAEDAPTLLPMRAPGAPEPRITLTAPALTSARHIHIVITGAEKRAALARAEAATSAVEAPVSILLQDATIHWAD